MNKIVRASDIARAGHWATNNERVASLSRAIGKPWNGATNQDLPSVRARVDHGRWIADCECGGAEYVDPDEPFFYCMSCGNHAVGGTGRPVIFPQGKLLIEIETAVLERGVEDGDDPAKVFEARAKDGIARSWNPGESVETLRLQHQAAKEKSKSREMKNGI